MSLPFATTVAILLLISLTANTLKADGGGGESNNSLSSWLEPKVADTIADEEEFQMESEATKRLLAQGNAPHLDYNALDKGSPVCEPQKSEPQRYANCIVQINKYHRPCSYYDQCKRDG